MSPKALRGQTQHCLRRDAVRRITVLCGRSDGPEVKPALEDRYSSHSISPQAVLRLAAQCFGVRPSGWLLGIRPMDLESFAEGLTPEAEANLSAAVTAFREAVGSGRLAPGKDALNKAPDTPLEPC